MIEITEDQKRTMLAVLSDRLDSKLLTSLNSCVRCGLCAESCVYYQATGDERMIPARKVELLGSVYKYYFRPEARLLPAISGARAINGRTVGEMVDLFFGACTGCGRCEPHCSIGVAIAHVNAIGRAMLSEAGLTPASLQSTVNAALETGNNMAIPTEEFVDTIRWMEEEMQDEINDNRAKIPLDERDVNVLYTLNPREPKFFPLSISAMAKVFYAAGESWTLSTRMYDVTNYAFFSGHSGESRLIAERLRDEVFHLRAKTVVLAECGHGSRAFRWEAPNYLGHALPFETLTSVELIHRYIRQNRIRLDGTRLKERVTLHDPCNLVRSGGIIREQREIIGRIAEDFREMTPHGADNLCCGGGGGQLAMSEYNERRLKIGELKAGQIRNTGASIVVTPCHNCVDQLSQLNFTYKLGVRIMTLAELVADALIFDE